jgi:hypothetical protein
MNWLSRLRNDNMEGLLSLMKIVGNRRAKATQSPVKWGWNVVTAL